MGRKVADATKAWRNRRTRGETVRRFVLEAWALEEFAADFFAAAL
jgi:hypothetical protein